MPPFKPQTYSSAAELPQIAQSKLFKFQFGGNAKIENKISMICTFLVGLASFGSMLESYQENTVFKDLPIIALNCFRLSQ